MKFFYRNPKAPRLHAEHVQPTARAERAQAIVEFAIVLPILMVVLVGMFEAGRMLYTYAAVNNASREAVRFGSALGYDDDGYHKYRHCDGIRQMARNEDATLDISMAKVFCTTMNQYVSTTCVQLFGGAGYMYENLAGRAFVDSRLAAIGGGADEVMKQVVAKMLGI